MIPGHSIVKLVVRLVKSSITKEPVKLIIETTRRCNNPHCITCNMGQIQPGIEINTEDLLRSVAGVARSILWISLTGGEVTLYKNLPILVRKLKETCKNLAMINIPLNGINPVKTSEVIDQIVRENKSILFHVTLSIDGIGECQNRLRGPKQWKQSVETWKQLLNLKKSHKNLKVSVQTTVSQSNLHDPNGAMAVMEEYAKQSDTFIVAFAMENEFYANEEGAEFSVSASDLEAIRQFARKYPIKSLESILEKLFLFGMVRRLRRGSAGIPCVAGKQVLFLAADGEVRPCPFFDRSMGNLGDFDYDLHNLLASTEATTTQKQAAVCDRCWNNCVGLPSLALSPVRALRVLREGVPRKCD